MLSKEKQQIAQYATLSLGLLVMLVVVLLRVLDIQLAYDRYCFAFGAVLTLAERLTERYRGKNLRIARLYRMGKVSSLLYCTAAFFLFSPNGKWQDCLAFLVAGAVMQIYVSIAYEYEVKKEQKKKQGQPDDQA